MMTGKALDIIPYINHREIPKTKMEYIVRDISFVDLFFKTKTT